MTIFTGAWLFEGVQDWFEGLGNDVLDVPRQVWQNIWKLAPSGIEDAFNAMWRFSWHASDSFWDFVGDPVGALGGLIGNLRYHSPQWLIDIFDTLTKLWSVATYKFWDFVQDPTGWLVSLVQGIYSHSPLWLRDIFDTLSKFSLYASYAFWSFMRDPTGVVSGAVSGIRSKVDDIKTWMDNFKFPEVVIPSITWPNWEATIIEPIKTAFDGAVAGIQIDFLAPLKDFSTWAWEGLSIGATKVAAFLNAEVINPLISGLRWLWDRMVIGLSSLATNLVDHVRQWGIITPETAMAHLPGLIALTAGAGLGVVALDAVTSIKILGSGLELGPVGDYLNRFINPGMVTGLALGAILTAALGTPLTHWANNQFRPIMFDAETLNRALWRGLITEAEWAAGYGYLGFNAERIDVHRQLRVRLPDIGDVIRYAVREAFYDDYSLEYGLDEEYPTQLTRYGKMLGFMEETLKYDWRSHWALPSLTMGYDMLHRGIIMPPDLDNLFKAHDIIPWWRERLTKLSFRVYTRVDVRRMYALGILTREGVKRSYLDLGYDPEKAEGMTRFTVAYYESGDRELTKTDILKGYRTGQLLFDDSVELLVDLDYTEDHAAYLLSLEDHRGKEEGRELSRSQLEKAFIEGLIPGSELITKLGDAGWTKEASDLIYQMALIRKQESETTTQVKVERDVSRAVINRALILGVISEDVARERLRELRYTESAVELFLAIDKARMIEEPKRLPLGTLREALRKEKITEAEFRRRAGVIGYPTDDIDIVVAMEAA